MQRTEGLSERERFIRATAERLKREEHELPATNKTRTCSHCGAQTTFALQDRAGWYACVECGRYA